MSCWMTTFEATPETIAGFIRMFKCERCNKCELSVKKIFLLRTDVERLAKHFGITGRQFLNRYAYMEGGSWYLPAPCPFFDGEGCTVHYYKPNVCIQFPFNQTVKCGDRTMLTINVGCPAGKKLAEKVAINPESVGVKV